MKKGLKKSDRLYQRNDISLLFKEGEKLKSYPIVMIYRIVAESEMESKKHLKAAWSVPKRNFKKAVDRNALKRKIREAYRLNKYKLEEKLQIENKCIHLIFIYTTTEKVSYKKIEDKIILLLQRLQSTV